ncbi:hypothetical protein [Alicyclobacillus fodiniaquatilis]|uniref:Uncharacterized protein n=1 Tax=Alicyclobacillus fodiniaquatilis TaxID=1661150 RepID=A0ABW4JKR4_9BACL
MHTLLELVLVIVIGVLFTLLVRYRPGGEHLSIKKTACLFVVGVVIGVIFLSTHVVSAPTGL